MADKNILEFVESSTTITEADFDNEREKNNTAHVPTSSEMRNVMKSMLSYLYAHSNDEMLNKMDDIVQFLDNLMRKKNAKKATRGLLATDHVILNHGQLKWTTPDLAPPLLTTTPHQREDVSTLDRFNVHRCPTRWVFSGTRFELMTCLPGSDTLTTGLPQLFNSPAQRAHAPVGEVYIL
ncbi:uncharacterized protein TNCV_3532171 [Trichonephila clavipes]|nr:uncharacterized protein TNCV_3532171 [Trichonephila clavipes]